MKLNKLVMSVAAMSVVASASLFAGTSNMNFAQKYEK